MSKHERIEQFEIETDAVRVLRRAREMVEKEGWSKRIPYEVIYGKKARCAGFAIEDAARELKMDPFEAEQFFQHVIGLVYIPGWNDHPKRIKEDVLAAFNKAIRIAS
jgi:hypothetical protein